MISAESDGGASGGRGRGGPGRGRTGAAVRVGWGRGRSVCLLLRLGRLVDLRPVLVCWSAGLSVLLVLRSVLGAWGADARKPGGIAPAGLGGVGGLAVEEMGVVCVVNGVLKHIQLDAVRVCLMVAREITK
jgi:hypothetical protein